MMGGLDILRASALPVPCTRESRESATTSPREGSSQRSTAPLATTEISVGCSGSPPHFKSRSMRSKREISSERSLSMA